MSKRIVYLGNFYSESLKKGLQNDIDVEMEETNLGENPFKSGNKKLYNIFFLSTSVIIFIFPIISIMIIKIDDFQETAFVFIGNILLILTYILILIAICIVIATN